jgi:hypothetical protein
VADEAQRRKIVEWIKREINDAWDNRENIEPRFTKAERPQLIKAPAAEQLPEMRCDYLHDVCIVGDSETKDESRCSELNEDEKRILRDFLAPYSMRKGSKSIFRCG